MMANYRECLNIEVFEWDFPIWCLKMWLGYTEYWLLEVLDYAGFIVIVILHF